jgi:ABC-type transport system substrate-binding protein
VPDESKVARALLSVRSAGDSFDPHMASSPSMTTLHSLAFSRLLAYSDQVAGVIEPDLADSLPEQPDEATLIVTVRRAVKYQYLPPLDGSGFKPSDTSLGAGAHPGSVYASSYDVNYSIERQATDPTFPRHYQWAMLDKAEITTPLTVTAQARSALAPLLHYFADTHSFIVHILVAGGGFPGPESIVGSGPFEMDAWSEGVASRLIRNSEWYPFVPPPRLDGLEMLDVMEADLMRAALANRAVDFGTVPPALHAELRELPGLQEAANEQLSFHALEFFAGAPPFADARLRQAVALAIDRDALSKQLRGGVAAPLRPWISAPLSAWALPAEDANTLPGDGNSEGALQDARTLFEEAGGASLGPFGLLYDSADSDAAGLAATLAAQLAENLGLQATAQPADSGQLQVAIAQGQAALWVARREGWLDPDDWYRPHFHSSANRFGLADSELDKLIERQLTELDVEARRETVHDLERRLAELNVAINLGNHLEWSLSQSYVKDLELDILPGYQWRWHKAWLDQSHPDWASRPP